MNIIKRRAAGGRVLHFLEGVIGLHAQTALCGKRARWRYSESETPDPRDCLECRAVFMRRGGVL